MPSFLRCVVFLLAMVAARDVCAQEAYTLKEPVEDDRVFQVDVRAEIGGQLRAAVGDGKAQALDLDAEARHGYLERRLAGTGRNAAALRTLRHYAQSRSDIKVGEHSTSARLREERRRIVAQGRQEGIVFYSPRGRLTRGELDLLETPGDSLALLGLLPPQPVETGEEWTPESWVLQMLTSTEAVLENELKCTLVSVDDGVAKVRFEGAIEGAVVGAATEIELEGEYLYDLDGRFIKRASVTQTEDRSVGTVSPGMKVEANVTLKRSPAANPEPLTDRVAESIPLEPDESLMELVLETPWHIRLRHGRNWHVFQQTGKSVILRLMEKGSLIAQCNLMRIARDTPGNHTSERQFQRDIRQTLGERLSEISRAEQLKVDDGRFLYRVTAAGKVKETEMHWIYYLCAAPSGRQTSMVFAVESKLLDELEPRDMEFVQSIEFLDPDRKPPRAAGGR